MFSFVVLHVLSVPLTSFRRLEVGSEFIGSAGLANDACDGDATLGIRHGDKEIRCSLAIGRLISVDR